MKTFRLSRLFPSALAVCLVISSAACGDGKNKLTTLRLNEVVHSIFYAPQYAAMALGYFEEEGLAIDISAGQGADKSMVALLSNDADIGLMGTEAAIYVMNEGSEDCAIAFAQLTQTAGNFLVAREGLGGTVISKDAFKWEDLKGKTIIGGRAGGMPQMMLEFVLRENGIEPGKDVEIVQNLQFASTAGAFAGGVGDYTAEFDPSARALETGGYGKVVASIGEEVGGVPYTVYMAKQSYINKHGDILQKFTNAIYMGQQYVASHTAAEIAGVIAPYFEGTSLDDLAIMIDRYKRAGAWNDNPKFKKDGYDKLVEIMRGAGALDEAPAFEKIVTGKYCEKAVNMRGNIR